MSHTQDSPPPPEKRRNESGFSRWRQDLREQVVRRGVKMMCGTEDFVPTSAADDVSLISGGMRLAWLRTLGALGIRDIIATSGLGYRFVCHIGDLAEYPFYHRRAFEKELAVSAAWLDGVEQPVVYDIGANVGFIATHLAQMLAARSPQIYAFEPVPATFAMLVRSVSRLDLGDRVHPIAAALVEEAQPVRIAVSEQSSMLSQVVGKKADLAHSNGYAYAPGITLDEFSAWVGTRPALMKMDIEGSEVAALSGARSLLSGEDRPAILFEHSPPALAERGVTPEALAALMPGYAFYYVNDLNGQVLPFGEPVADLGGVTWQCNLFAAPLGQEDRWHAALDDARRRLSTGRH